MTFESAILGVVLVAALIAAIRLFVSAHLQSSCGVGNGCRCNKGNSFSRFLEEERKKRAGKSSES